MTRQNALLRLHKNLLAQRESLAKKQIETLAHLHDDNTANAAGDRADFVLESDGDRASPSFAQLVNPELRRVEWALEQWDEGLYGICDICQEPISLVHLRRIPHAPFCATCVRELERLREALDGPANGNRGQVSDSQRVIQDQDGELETQMSGDRPSASKR